MKKLTKLRLKEYHEMNDSEMKSIRGGYGGFGKKCPSGSSDYQCFGSCEEELVVGDTTYLLTGSCHFSGMTYICACVFD